MPRFSIVVPAYNVEPYISECLDSLLSQTFDDFEVVCIDDASTDGTGKIIESYCTRDSRLNLVTNNQNMQLFASRHIGASKTSGDYVMFVDGDDTLLPDTLENLDIQLAMRPVDILQFPMEVVFSDRTGMHADEGSWFMAKTEPEFFEGPDIMSTICYKYPDDLCAHHRVIKGDLARSVLNKLGLEHNLYVAEDIVEMTALMLAARTYEIIDSKPFYQYHFGRGFNNLNQTVTKERFIQGATAKRRCYTTLMRYLDRENLHRCGVSEPVAWRWRYSCIQTLYEWQNSVSLDDRLETIVAFSELWPAPWTLPSVFQFIADDAGKLLYGRLEAEQLSETKRSLALNLDCLGSLYDAYNANLSNNGEAARAWTDVREGFDSFCFFNNDSTVLGESVAYLLKCVRAMSLCFRNELWSSDDFTVHAKSMLKEAEEWKADAYRMKTASNALKHSRAYKLGAAIAAPYRIVRYGRNEE